MVQRVRDSRIEVLRIISMLFIIIGHFAWQTQWHFSESDSTMHVSLVHSLWIGGKLGVDLFVLISGYFLIKVDCKINPNAVRTKKISFL